MSNAPIPEPQHFTRDDLLELELRPDVELDLRYLHEREELGGITRMLSWNFAPGNEDAVMLLAPSYVPRGADEDESWQPGICVIHRNDAWKWSRTHNDDKAMAGLHLADGSTSGDEWQEENAAYFADVLELDSVSVRTRNRIREMIEDRLDELVAMPPAPIREDAEKVTFTTTSLSTGKVEEIDVQLN